MARTVAYRCDRPNVARPRKVRMTQLQVMCAIRSGGRSTPTKPPSTKPARHRQCVTSRRRTRQRTCRTGADSAEDTYRLVTDAVRMAVGSVEHGGLAQITVGAGAHVGIEQD